MNGPCIPLVLHLFASLALCTSFCARVFFFDVDLVQSTEKDMENLFLKFGKVTECRIATDREVHVLRVRLCVCVRAFVCWLRMCV